MVRRRKVLVRQGRWAGTACLACLACGLLAAGVQAQPGPGDSGGRGGFRGPFDPQEFLRRLDANGNGIIDPEEQQGPAAFFLQRRMSEMGLEPGTPVPVNTILQQVRDRPWGSYGGPPGGSGGPVGPGGPGGPPPWARGPGGNPGDSPGSWGGARDRDSSSGNRSSSSQRESRWANVQPEPLVPGFEVSLDLPPVPGFGEQLENPTLEQLRAKYDERVVERVERALREYDRNGNGILDLEEWRTVDWRTDPRESDLNKDGKLTRLELAERYVRYYSSGAPGSSSSSSGSSSGSSGSSSGSSGSSGSSSGSSGDGPRSWGWSSGGSWRGGSSGGSSSGGSAQVDDRIRAFADMALQRFDSNRDGRLQRDEWGRMRDNPQAADRNGDGIITRDELAQYLADRGRERWGDVSRSSDSSAGSDSDRKSYRFLTAAERLPKGLPEWFTTNDANGDGQISMAEFATNWNDAKVEEFLRYDLNGDGIITAAECQTAAPPKR